MKDKKVIPAWVGIVSLILAVVCMAWCFFDIISAIQNPAYSVLRTIGDVIVFILMIFALEYGFKGYKKNSANLFKIFTILYLLYSLNAVMLIHLFGYSDFLVLVKAVSFGCICVLALALDLGKKKSNILCAVNLLMSIIELIVVICLPEVGFGDMGPVVSGVVASLVLGLMIYAKYCDKEIRGTV